MSVDLVTADELVASLKSGLMKIILGRAWETESAVTEVIRRSPRCPMMSNGYFWIGIAELFLNRIDRAFERLRKSTLIDPNLSPTFSLSVIAGFLRSIKPMPRRRRE